MDFFGQSRTQVESRNKLAFSRRMNALVADAADSELGSELDRTRKLYRRIDRAALARLAARGDGR